MKELQKYADSPYLKKPQTQICLFRWRNTILFSAQQLAELTDQMKSIISWDEAEEVTFDANPARFPKKLSH